MKLGKRFPKRRIVITGAGSGLGKQLALQFARDGWRVCAADINLPRAEKTAAEVTARGGEGLALHCDVTRPADLEKAARLLKKKWGGVDILINNAGVAGAGYFEKIPLKTWDRIIDINQKSIIYGCRAFIPLMKNQGSGYIVNVASNAGLASLAEMGSYNMTKAAAISASETLRMELAPHNIGVSVICPTFFKSNLMDGFTAPDERQQKMAEKFFEKSRATAEKVARHVCTSIRKNRMYVITQGNGKFFWWAKRHFPETYFRATAFIYRKGYIDRYLGIR